MGGCCVEMAWSSKGTMPVLAIDLRKSFVPLTPKVWSHVTCGYD